MQNNPNRQNDQHVGSNADLNTSLNAHLNERLHLAVSSRDAAAASAILAQGADVNGERGEGGDFAGWTPLDVAAHRGDEGVCRLLLDGGAALRLEDHLPLIMAAGEGHEAVCRLLLQSGAEVNAEVGPGFSALMVAVEMGKTPIVRLLLTAGANPNATRIFVADFSIGAQHGRPGTEPGRSGTVPGGKEQRGQELSCLMVAATAGHADLCHLLAGHGAAIEARGLFGLTALGLAAHGGRLDACQALLDAGADSGARAAEGDTPLLLAAAEGHTEVCRLLLDRGADVDARNVKGRSALMNAAVRQDADLVFLLTGYGADASFLSEAPDDAPGFCPQCGAPRSAEGQFCPKCGQPCEQSPFRSSPPPRSLPRPLEPGSPTIIGGLSHVDYSRIFASFEAAGGKWVPTFNLLAFLLGPIWYLLKGMWLKAIVLSAASFFLILGTGGLAAIIPWIYYGVFANWDLYLWEKQGKQGW